MRSDARKRIEDARCKGCGGVFACQPSCPELVNDLDDFTRGYAQAMDELRAALWNFRRDYGGWPQMVPLSALYHLVGDPTTWTPDGAA